MQMKEWRDRIEECLEGLVPKTMGPSSLLHDAARHALLGGGKRLRPLLTLITTESLGGDPEEALHPACALEMIHTYSLIHDDLPCMDDDDLRRGKPTVHRAFTEAHAVLAGDFLLTYAFEVIASAPFLTADQKVALTSTLAKGAGGHSGMIAGQVMDIEATGKDIPLASLEQIHLAKTGALISTAIEFGAIIAGVQREPLKVFGQNIGLAFQVVDDILDVTAADHKHGFATDRAKDKPTYVSLLGLEAAQETANKLLIQAHDALKPLPFDTTNLADIANKLVLRQK